MFDIANIDLHRRAKTLKLGIAALVAVVVLGMWATVGGMIYFSREAALENMQSNAANLAFAFDDEVTHTLDAITATMDAVADRMRAEGSDMNIHEWSREFPIVTGPIIEGSIIAPNGMLISSTLDRDALPVDLSGREHFRVHLDGTYKGLFISKPVTGRVSKKITIQISQRVEDKDGRFIGVLVFSLSPAKLTKLNKSIDLGESGTITLIGFDNIIRARFSKNSPDGLVDMDNIGRSIPNSLRPDDVPENGYGSYIIQSAVDHIQRLYSYRRVADYPLFASVGLGYDEGLASWRANAKMMLALAAVVTLLLGGLTLYLTREIDRRTVLDLKLADERNKLQEANIKLQVTNTELIGSMERSEAANQAKSSFLANMSHEFRTPLNAIIGFSQIIRDQIMGPVGKPVYTDYAKDVCDAGEHLLGLINNVLDASRVEVNKFDLKEETVEIGELVQSAIQTVRVQAGKKSIALEQRLPEEPVGLRADTLRLRQVLINLLANAVKFTPEGGRVTLSFEASPAAAVFAVADTGIGMSPDEIAVATEPFRQIENALVKRHEGIGLGLSLAKHMTELHGGTLEIESEKGVGTTVRVVLPLELILHAPKASAAA